MITDPDRISDPSPTSFQNLFDSDNTLSSASKSAAVSGFAISYLDATYEGFNQGIDMIDRGNTTKDLKISFDKPEYKNNQIKITNV